MRTFRDEDEQPVFPQVLQGILGMRFENSWKKCSPRPLPLTRGPVAASQKGGSPAPRLPRHFSGNTRVPCTIPLSLQWKESKQGQPVGKLTPLPPA